MSGTRQSNDDSTAMLTNFFPPCRDSNSAIVKLSGWIFLPPAAVLLNTHWIIFFSAEFLCFILFFRFRNLWMKRYIWKYTNPVWPTSVDRRCRRPHRRDGPCGTRTRFILKLKTRWSLGAMWRWRPFCPLLIAEMWVIGCYIKLQRFEDG